MVVYKNIIVSDYVIFQYYSADSDSDSYRSSYRFYNDDYINCIIKEIVRTVMIKNLR